MSTLAKLASIAVLLESCIVCTGPVNAADRPAEAILKEIDAVKPPVLDSKKKDDRAAIRDNQIRRREAAEKRARLIKDLYKVAPEHKRIGALLEERWNTLGMNLEKGRYDELVRELDGVLARSKDPKLKIEASFLKAQLKLNPISSKAVPDPSAVDKFLELAPKDARAASLLGAAVSATRDDKKRAALLARLKMDFPDSDLGGMLESTHDQTESVGKPFHLEFTDAISGSTVSMKGLKGKVVVIDFWATWCGPCVAEMPNMKALYSKYRDRGVEFIGVSLDNSKEEGGLDSLKKFVKEEGIKWPQFYQGKFWNGDFSKSWGIDSIPRVFVVDSEGKLHSVDAGGKLDEMIPELLAKKSGVATSADKGAK
jgi:thiol-disulfide isomerase/thioredoxin